MTLDASKHAKKAPVRVRRTLAEKRRRPTQSEASAMRAQRISEPRRQR